MNIRSKIFIVESNSDIEKKILNALKPELNKFLEKTFNKVKPKIIEQVIESIKAAPEYNSLLSGDLKYEFGLPDSNNRVSTILEFWKKITADFKKVTTNGNKLVGGFSISMINSDYSDVINSSVATLKTEKGTDLNWLEWLLLFGNKTIIKNYEVEFGFNPRSRTGRAIMKGVKSGKWAVPSEFSGTKNNNWITRSIDSIEPKINQIFKEAIK
jgi:hypothetical protein